MKVLRLLGFLGSHVAEAVDGVSIASLQSVRQAGADAYQLVEQLPRGRARLAAWNAYALQTYGDKLLDGGVNPSFTSQETAALASELFALSGWWVDQAHRLVADPSQRADQLRDPLPHFHTPIRSQAQLVGLRSTLEVLRAFVAYDLASLKLDDASSTELRDRLAAIDDTVATANILWLERPPRELRAGIGDALTRGLERVYALGQTLATRA